MSVAGEFARNGFAVADNPCLLPQDYGKGRRCACGTILNRYHGRERCYRCEDAHAAELFAASVRIHERREAQEVAPARPIDRIAAALEPLGSPWETERRNGKRPPRFRPERAD